MTAPESSSRSAFMASPVRESWLGQHVPMPGRNDKPIRAVMLLFCAPGGTRTTPPPLIAPEPGPCGGRLNRRRFAPGDQATNALAHVDLWPPTKQAFGQSMLQRPIPAGGQPHHARIRLDVFGFQGLAGELGEETYDLQRGRGPRARDLDGDVGSTRLKGGGVGARHVAHVHEMLDFRAIPQHAWPLAAAYAIVRFDDVERVGGAVVLPLAVNGCVAQHDVVEAPLAVGIAAELLADDLAGAIKDGSRRRADGMKRRALDQLA